MGKASYVSVFGTIWVEFWRFGDMTSPLTWSELRLLPSESRIGEETAFTDGVEVVENHEWHALHFRQ